MGAARSQAWRAKCGPAAGGAAWETVAARGVVAGVVSSVVRVATRARKPDGRRSYRISSGRGGLVPGSIDSSPDDGREKIRRFLIVMALARLWIWGVGLLSQPFSSTLSLLFTFFFPVLAGTVILGGEPETMAAGGFGAVGTAIARQRMPGLETLLTVFQQTAPSTRSAGASGLQSSQRRIMLRVGHGSCNSRRSSLGRESRLPPGAFLLAERPTNSDCPVGRNQPIPASQLFAEILVDIFAGTDTSDGKANSSPNWS